MKNGTKRFISLILALVMIVSMAPLRLHAAAETVAQSNEEDVLYEENFDSYGSEKISLSAGENKDYNLFVPSDVTSSWIENGRLYLTGTNRSVYVMGGEDWTDYTVEADLGFPENTPTWGGVAYYVQSGTKWQKGSVVPSGTAAGEVKMNGFNNSWTNNTDGVNSVYDIGIKNDPLADESDVIRVKIEASGTTASFSYARYDGEGNLGQWTKVLTIDNIAQDAVGGSVGIVTGGGITAWIDNLKVTKNAEDSGEDPSDDPTEDTVSQGWATNAIATLYEDDFNYGDEKITLNSGANLDYNIFVPEDTTSWIENGRLYLTGTNRTAYILGGEMWAYYTVEADIGYTTTNVVWGGLGFYVQSGTKWHKGNVRISNGESKLNGYDLGNPINSNGWVNDKDATNRVVVQDVINNKFQANEPMRMKIVANGKEASMYYARYNADGSLGEFKHVITIDNIPASSQSGSVGLAVGNGTTMWMDNLKVTRNLDVEESKHSLLKADFDEYTGENTATLASGKNADHYNLNFVKSNGSNGNVELKEGRMYITGNQYDTVYFDWADAQHWTDYVVEADMCYTASTGWNGLLYRVQEGGTSAQKGNLYPDGRVGLNGFKSKGGWVNDSEPGYGNKLVAGTAPVAVNKPQRVKIVVKDNLADIYYAEYTDNKLGEWNYLFSIDDIPTDIHSAGSVGFMTSGNGSSTSYWVDNIEVYEYTNTYVEDFGGYANATLATGANCGLDEVGLQVSRTATGGTVQVKDGALDFKAADSSTTSKFDAAWFAAGTNWTNYTFEADVTYKNGGDLNGSTQWGTLLYRVKDATSFQRGGLSYPKRVYLGGYADGKWVNNKDNYDKWNLKNSQSLALNETVRIKLVVEDNTSYLYYARYDDNGVLQPYTLEQSISHIPDTQLKGSVGMLGAVGINFLVDNVVVSAGKPQAIQAGPASYGVADINIPQTGIVNPPVVVMDVTKDNYSKIGTDKPTTALMDIDASMNIVDGTTVVAKAEDFLKEHHATVIPAFRVDSAEEADALITFLNDNGVMDAFVVATSDNAALLKTVRTACPKVRGILEYTSALDTYAKQAASRRLACSNLATVVLVPEGSLDAGLVLDYNARVISIWSYASNKAGVYDAIATGTNAVVSKDVAMVNGVYTGITETTISGIPMAIGHRGRDTNNWPENTNMAFHSAHDDCGAPIVELDIWLTADDKVVIMHDGSIDRTTTGSGSIASMTLAEIQQYQVESGDGTKTAPIPSLEDVFKEFQNDDLVIYVQTEDRTNPKIREEVKRLVDQYGMEDKVVIFARYGNGAQPYFTNSDFGEDLPFIGGDSGFPSGTAKNTVKTMIEYFAPYNHQGMPYSYNSVSGVSEDLYYAITARGFVPIHSTSNGQDVLDNYMITGYGCPGALTDYVQDISDYQVEIMAADETLQTGKAINLTKTVKQIKGEKTVTCGVEWISGDPLVASGDSYTMKNPGTATVAYYADVTLEEHESKASYRLYSQPVDITFQGDVIETVTLSILGDSISTYKDWSEGAAAETTNSNIANNYLFYEVGKYGVYLEDTWWYQAAQELGLDILVNNSWSGSCVFRERTERNSVGAYIARAEQLHDDTGSNAGEEPDVIAFFMGTNDINYYPETMGTFEAVNFNTLIVQGQNGFTYAEPTTTVEAYAIALHKMITRYDEAEIYLFTLLRKDSSVNATKKARIEQFNADVKKLADKFGVYVVDMYNDTGIAGDAFYDLYMGDSNHPKPTGMDALTGAFTSEFYLNSKYIPESETVYDVAYTLTDVMVDQGTAKAVLGGKPFARSLTTLAGRELAVTVTMGGTDITEQCYKDGEISIASVTGDITITAEGKMPAVEPGDYRWEKGSDGLLASVTTGGFASNPLTKLEGTVTNGVLADGRYQLTTPVVLKKDAAWSIEWKGSGYTNSYMVFANDTSSKADGVPFIFFHPSSHFVALGSYETATSTYQNYCAVFSDVNFNESHVYRMENKVTDSGSMVYLSVDGGEAKPMNAYYKGTTSQGTTGTWAGEQDYTFTYMGTTNHSIDGTIEYVQVRANEEAAPAVSSIAVTTSPKTAYYVGDKLDVTGGKVTVTYDDQTTKVIDLEEAMVSGFDSSAAGEKTLTVTYEGKTATYKIQVSQAPASIAGKYRWELDSTGLVSVITDGNTRNDLTKLGGSVSGGNLSGVRYQLTTPVVLKPDCDWYIEWQTTSSIAGNNSSLLFANDTQSAVAGKPFIFLRPESHLVAIGSHDGKYQNYGIQLDNVSRNESHIYRLQNEVTAQGNMVYLYVDGTKIGPMNNYFQGGTAQNSTGNWVADKTFTFGYMGTSNHPLHGDLSYVQVWQGKSKAGEFNAKATLATQLLMEEDFSSYGSEEIKLTAGANDDYNLFLGNGTASIKNGRLYLTSSSGYTNVYFLGGEMWNYYTVEADIAHAEGSSNWVGLSYFNQNGTKWQKGSITKDGTAKLNGYNGALGKWPNDGQGHSIALSDISGNNLKIDEPVRVKIVANGNKASMYYARYNADGSLGEYKHVLTIDNIPAASQGGGVGIVTGSKGAMWVDNLKVTRNLDSEESKHILMTADFNEYTGDPVTLADGLNADHYRLNYAKGSSTGNVTLKDGRLYMTGNSADYDYVYFDYPDAKHWKDYVVEADMCYTSASGWYGLLYRVKDHQNAQKGGLYLDDRAGLNGFADGKWANDSDTTAHKKPNAAPVNTNEPHRIKIVVKGQTADLFWAPYDANGNLGDWEWLITIEDIPADQTFGTVGLMSGAGGPATFWMDNLVVYEYTNTYVENFDSYSNTTLAPGASYDDKGQVGVTYVLDGGTEGNELSLKNGKLFFKASTKGSDTGKHDTVWFDAGMNWTNYTYEADITYHNTNSWSTMLMRVKDKDNWIRGGVGQPPSRIYLGNYVNKSWPNSDNVDKWSADNGIAVEQTFRIKLIVEDTSAYLYYAFYKDGVLQPYKFLKSMDKTVSTQLYTGTVGFLGVKGASFSVDNLVVSAGPAQTKLAPPKPILAEITIPKTGVVNPPVIVQQVEDLADYEALPTNGAAIAFMDIDSSMNILDSKGAVLKTAEDFVKDHGKKVIPAFRVDSDEEVTALGNFLKEKEMYDAFVVADSENAGRIKAVHDIWEYVGGILEYKTALTTLEQRAASRRLSNNSMASIILLPEGSLTAEIAMEYNVRAVNVWSFASDKAGVYSAIAAGYNGVIAADASVVTGVYESITETTSSGIPISIGHRGRHQTKVPENTVEAFRSAYEDTGASGIELDLKMTKDGVLVLMHDGTVDRSTNGTGNVGDFTLEELKKLDVQTEGNPTYTDKVPTFEEVLAWASENAPDLVIYSHMGAGADMVKQFNELVTKYKMEDNVIAFARYNANCGYKNSDFGNGLSFIGGNSSGPYDPVTNALAMDSQNHALESMVKVFRKYNHQSMPYEYDEVSNGGADDTYYYMMSARGFLGIHSTTNDEATYDKYAITGAGILGALTDFPEHASAYYTQVLAKDAKFNVGQAMDTKLTVKSTLSQADIVCGVEWISGDPLVKTDKGYTMEAEGKAVVSYYADVSMTRGYGTLKYRLYSEPVTVTFEVPYPTAAKVENLPNVTWYTQGYTGAMDLTNAELEVTYSDGSVKVIPITAAMISGFDTSALGTNTVTVSFTENEATVTASIDLSILTAWDAEAQKSAEAAQAAQTKAEAAQAAAEAAKAELDTAKEAVEAAKAEAKAAQDAADAAKADAEAAAEAAGKDASAAEEAAKAADAAQKKADEAQAKAEAAQAAAETAQAKNEEAQAKAEAAVTGAENAKTAAEAAAAAAKESDLQAAKEAAKAAEEALKATDEAAKAAEEAAKAAESAATTAVYAAEAAAEAAKSAGFAQDAAESAREAQEAKKAAEEAAKEAEEAAKAAEEAAKAAAEAALTGAKYQGALSIDSFAQTIDQTAFTREQVLAVSEAVAQAKANVAAAKDVAEVQKAVEEGMANITKAAEKQYDANPNGSAELGRLFGDNRFETSLQVANEMKRLLGKEKFDTVVVTSGLNFADALSGAYLAIGKDAPILLIDNRAKAFEENRRMITDYILANLVEGGTVYILGGENAVPAGMDAGLTGYNVVQLAGENRYATNLAILAETGLGNRELLICSAKNFADSVSAAAAGRPILMVGSKLTQEQKDFLAGIKNDMVIIGGPAAVSEKVAAELAEYGNVTRIGGANRFETSVMIAENLFTKSTGAVLAYAKSFPDALCSGPLAYRLNAPILLTQTGNTTASNAMTGDVTFGLVIGGPGLISDDTVRAIFGQNADSIILKK